MSFEWPLVTVEEIAAKQPNAMSTGPFGSAISSKYFTDSGVPVIRGSNLSTDISTRIIDKGIVFVSFEKAKEFSRSVAKVDDLVFTCWGTINQVGLIDASSEWKEYIISNKQMKLTVDKNIADPRYVYYVFSSPEKQLEIIANGIGAAVPGFNLGQLKKHSLKLPPLNIQRAIADHLELLDKKLTSNRQINQTLEQIAQALFKSWFVDFEPVKAKIAVLEAGGSQEEATLAAMTAISGKDTDSLAVFAHERPEQYAELKATAELFPSAMQDSELGEIPVGWEVGELSDLALLNTSSWTKKNAPESVSYVDLANTKWGVINSVEEFIFSDAPSRARRILKPLDTIIGTVRPGNGSYAYINKDGLTGSTGFAVLTPKQEIFSEYIYLCATSKESIERLAHLADGGAYPAVNADVVLSTQCIIPSEQKDLESLLREFSSKTKNIFSYSSHNLEQNIILSQIRDTLLPKLLSGEITLPEAETWAAQVDTQEA
ncbi:restriction endonuclease subunit S [Yersinia enterocolitica]|uniref:restriction endonuclease subunit S n=1 Tax=Yersinia enterocolitica TaxID=630 RepID=UPI00398D3DDE